MAIMKFIRNLLYRIRCALVGWIPRPLLRGFLRILHVRPEVTDRVGYQVYPQVFYNPFPEPSQVDLARLEQKRDLPGIDYNSQTASGLLPSLARYAKEVSEFIQNRPAHLTFWNMTYPVLDSATLYAMLRHLKPRRYIEIGCGYSSRVSVAALARNATEGSPCQCAFIEPYPPPYLTELNLPGEFIVRKIQDVPLEKFQALTAGDVLFIDTSHVIKVQNDVEYEFLHILPSLKPGVFVHIHDIFSPYDYPAELLVGTGPNRGGNNEQYALECLLSGGKSWEVALPVYLLWKEHRKALEQLINSDDRPAAFWIRKRE
jgi:hypothetical protein